MRAFWALFKARNKEFYRDRGTMAWNLVFPLIVILGLGVVFSGNGRALYKVGILDEARVAANGYRAFLDTEHVQFVQVSNLEDALDKVRHHQFDLVLQGGAPPRYWVNASNPKGYMLERVLWSAGGPGNLLREHLTGREIRYVDWLVPGVLAMNMMFSCLWGVGYVIVRYRKGGILRRFKVAPIGPVTFISAQIASRLMLVMSVTALVFFGTDLLLDFYIRGSVLLLFTVFTLGAICLIALGVLIAARTSSQELAGGLLNLGTWPMMFLSGVWFSLEGSPPWLVMASKALPLTHLIDAARGIMVDGMTLLDVWPQMVILMALSLVFLGLGAWFFRWE